MKSKKKAASGTAVLTSKSLKRRILDNWQLYAMLLEQNRCAMACQGCGAVFTLKYKMLIVK